MAILCVRFVQNILVDFNMFRKCDLCQAIRLYGISISSIPIWIELAINLIRNENAKRSQTITRIVQFDVQLPARDS